MNRGHTVFRTIEITDEMIEEIRKLEQKRVDPIHIRKKRGDIYTVAAEINQKRREMYG